MEMNKGLREVRRRLDMSARELAEKTGLSVNFIYSFESGKVGISYKNIEKIIEALGCKHQIVTPFDIIE